jgi:hypothetical protein
MGKRFEYKFHKQIFGWKSISRSSMCVCVNLHNLRKKREIMSYIQALFGNKFRTKE